MSDNLFFVFKFGDFMRKKIIAGNWKMNKTFNDALNLSEALVRHL